MQSQVCWGIALVAIGAVVAVAAITWFPPLLAFAVPLIVIGVALLIWRGREEIIEPIKE